MSTTVTAVAVADDNYAVGNLGDSRAYLLRDGSLTRLTRDDSYVQELIDSGALDEEAARTHPQRSVVTAVLDGQADRRPTIATVPARAGDRLLLCSDGLTDLVDEAAVRSRAAGGLGAGQPHRRWSTWRSTPGARTTSLSSSPT